MFLSHYSSGQFCQWQALIICILQMGKLRLCLRCKVGCMVHGSVPIILPRDSRLEIFVQLKQKMFKKSLLIELMP